MYSDASVFSSRLVHFFILSVVLFSYTLSGVYVYVLCSSISSTRVSEMGFFVLYVEGDP